MGSRNKTIQSFVFSMIQTLMIKNKGIKGVGYRGHFSGDVFKFNWLLSQFLVWYVRTPEKQKLTNFMNNWGCACDFHSMGGNFVKFG